MGKMGKVLKVVGKCNILRTSSVGGGEDKCYGKVFSLFLQTVLKRGLEINCNNFKCMKFYPLDQKRRGRCGLTWRKSV